MKTGWLLVLLPAACAWTQDVDVKSGHPYHKGCLIWKAAEAEVGPHEGRKRMRMPSKGVGDDFIEVTTGSVPTMVRVSAIERYKSQGDNTLIIFQGGSEITVSETYDEVGQRIALSGAEIPSKPELPSKPPQ